MDLKVFGLAGCVWTEAVYGREKLWIQKYPDIYTCGRGLDETSLIIKNAAFAH